MIPDDWWPGLIGFGLLFLANPVQWYLLFKRRSSAGISTAWVGLPIVARFVMGWTAAQHPVWLVGNALILVSCVVTLALVIYYKFRGREKDVA